VAKKLFSVQRAAVRARFVLLLPRSSPTDQTRWWSFQSRKQTASPKKLGFTRNRTRPTTKSNPFLLFKKHTCSFGERWLGLPMHGEKGENPTRGYDFS